MSLISVRKSDVPAYLHKSDFYLALNDDDEDEEVQIPQNCFKPDTDVKNADDLTLLLSTLRFWGVSAIPQSVVTYTVWHKPVEVINAFAEFEEELRYVKFLRALCEEIDQCSGQAGENDASAWCQVEAELRSLRCTNKKTALLCVYQYEYKDNGMAWTENTCQLAAAAEEPEILRFLHEHGCPWDETCCESAARATTIACLQYAHQNGCPWDSKTCSAAALRSHSLPCLQYAHEHGCLWDSAAYENARYKGPCYMYLLENGCPEGEGVVSAAARAGDLERVKALHEKGCPWSERASDAAAEGGHLSVLRYLHEAGCPIGEAIGGLAVVGGSMACVQYLWENKLIRGDVALGGAARNKYDLECFRYLVDVGCGRENAFLYAAVFENPDAMRYAMEKGCPLPANALEVAAARGSVECLRIALESGCSWSVGTCASIVWSIKVLKVFQRSKRDVSSAKLACLRYAHEHGCPWDEMTCQNAARSEELSCLQYAHEHGCPWTVDAVKDAATAGSLSCLQYLHEHGCEWPEPAWFQQVAKTVRNRKCLEYSAEHPDQRPAVHLTPPVDCTGCCCVPSTPPAQPQGCPVQNGLPEQTAEEGGAWQVVGKRGRAVRNSVQPLPVSSTSSKPMCASHARPGPKEESSADRAPADGTVYAADTAAVAVEKCPHAEQQLPTGWRRKCEITGHLSRVVGSDQLPVLRGDEDILCVPLV